jgi:FtsP/CotA-like multicopper oxidase with cupredoxin domain
MWRAPVWAVTSPGQPNVLSGTEFDLYIGELPVNITGQLARPWPSTARAWADPSLARRRHRDAARAQPLETGHLHPLARHHPAGQHGRCAGPELPWHRTRWHVRVQVQGPPERHYWYHSHSGLQEQVGVYGALVIDAKDPEPFTYDRDYVVMLSDWTDEDPARVLAKLKKQSDYYNFHKRTVGDFVDDVSEKGWSAAVADRKMWAEMKMSPTDLADVSGYTYTYLMNGQAPNGNWTGIFKPGEKIRLRFINGSAMTYFDVRIPGLKMTVVAADGQHVKPVRSMSSGSPLPKPTMSLSSLKTSRPTPFSLNPWTAPAIPEAPWQFVKVAGCSSGS